jgi:hypothetical protein
MKHECNETVIYEADRSKTRRVIREQRTFPALRLRASFALFSSRSWAAFLAFFSDIFARSSSSFCFFSSSVRGLIYLGRIDTPRRQLAEEITHFLSGFFKLIMARFFSMEIRKIDVLEYFAALGALDGLSKRHNQPTLDKGRVEGVRRDEPIPIYALWPRRSRIPRPPLLEKRHWWTAR